MVKYLPNLHAKNILDKFNKSNTKKENGILSPLQELRLSELKKHGCQVYVWSDWNVEFKTKIS